MLLLDAGDIFQGTPYFNFYGGELELKLMSAILISLIIIHHQYQASRLIIQLFQTINIPV